MSASPEEPSREDSIYWKVVIGPSSGGIEMLRLVTDHGPEPELLSEEHDRVQAIEAALTRPPHPLHELDFPGPGAYLFLYVGPLDLYARIRRPVGMADLRPIVLAGGAPIYIGSAKSLRERRQRHVRNLEKGIDISSQDLLVIPLHTRSLAGALYLEAILIDAFKPVWNQPWLAGFGSQPQGRARLHGQRTPAWTLLHPGRQVAKASPPPRSDLENLRVCVRDHLESTVSSMFTMAAYLM